MFPTSQEKGSTYRFVNNIYKTESLGGLSSESSPNHYVNGDTMILELEMNESKNIWVLSSLNSNISNTILYNPLHYLSSIY